MRRLQRLRRKCSRLRIRKPHKSKSMRNNLSVNQQTPPLITRTIYNSRFLSTVEMMLFILEQYIWDHQRVNQQELFSILVLNISLSPVSSVMMKRQETLNLRSTIPYPAASLAEIKSTRDARQWPMTCTALNHKKYYLRLPVN